ncbi:hypothetical protein L484_023126 [Morus notabilis]|uniref:DUF4378 domain-containing protein n=1 Tax=Morus notabilis TaxID=981085 RepID=W9S6J9_9ROSA|nr:hypothetical protein L484_023126 [Morus notabilis]
MASSSSSSASLSSDTHDNHDQMLMMIRKPIMIEHSMSKPLMLKDYLLDDLSSCSSNGFKSFPRRQCCTTVRFLLEIDLTQRSSSSSSSDRHKKKSHDHHDQRRLWRSRSRSSSTMSALQRATDAVINAVKFLPFPSVKSSIHNKSKKVLSSSSLLPRSLSRKLLMRNRFWGRSDQKIRRSRFALPDQVLQERCEPSDENTISTTAPTVVTVTAGRVSTSTSSNSKSNSWCESEFANSDMLSSTENDVAESEKEVSQKINRKVDITVGDDHSTEDSTTVVKAYEIKCVRLLYRLGSRYVLSICGIHGVEKRECIFRIIQEWPNEEEKEQFSPVSVLDCPFEDDDHDETSSPFHHKLARLEGNKQKLLQKIRSFEKLTQLEPIDLEKRIAMSELEDKLVTISNVHEDYDREKRNGSEEKAREMMKLIRVRTSTTTALTAPLKIDNLVSKADNLLFDFFRERVMEEGEANDEAFNQKEALKVAEDWVNGETAGVLLGWEVKEARNGYVKDMEKSGKWGELDEERNEIVLEVESQLWNSLVHELLLHLL